ncbi:predicted protein [Plenodomus lingam JN3]|uniref:Predicted protein n=1 Tax=Leptosphaeria maculans (strain JN3 / isolate v23.1.3 / race Av1-4-5-6-7-8) TaxID=985895 RepID=E4ZWT3_LEPMJ|nr:predicted protein [Plenodomus lingam JN3]CBX96059.1 predicted protein [Plenodomus lingam JN3]
MWGHEVTRTPKFPIHQGSGRRRGNVLLRQQSGQACAKSTRHQCIMHIS